MIGHFVSLRFMIAAFTVVACVSSPCAWKKEAHFLTIPIIEGMGIYSSLRILQDPPSSGTKVSAITGLSLLCAQAAVGSWAIFGPQPNYPKIRRIHRYVGYALAAAAFWMSVSAANDGHVENETRNFTHGFAITAAIPVIMFSF